MSAIIQMGVRVYLCPCLLSFVCLCLCLSVPVSDRVCVCPLVQVESALLQYPSFVSICTESWLRFPVQVILRLYTVVFLGYSCIPFVAVVRRRWWPLFKSVYLCGHIFFLTWPVVVPAIHHAMRICGVKRVRPQRAAESEAPAPAAAAPAAAASVPGPSAEPASGPSAAPVEAKKEL